VKHQSGSDEHLRYGSVKSRRQRICQLRHLTFSFSLCASVSVPFPFPFPPDPHTDRTLCSAMDGAKQRFSSFKAFKFTSAGGSSSSHHQPPPVPPKEYPAAYNSRSFGSVSSSSLVPTQHLGPSSENISSNGGAPESPAYSYSQQLQVATPSPLGMSTQHPNGSGYFNEGSSSGHGNGQSGQHNGNGGFRKSIMKLTSLSRKPFNRQASQQSSMTSLREDAEVPQPAQEDPGISIPWGFQVSVLHILIGIHIS